jgi:hypothetical protein
MSGLRVGDTKISILCKIDTLAFEPILEGIVSARGPPKIPVGFSSVIFLVGKEVLIGSPMPKCSFEEL